MKSLRRNRLLVALVLALTSSQRVLAKRRRTGYYIQGDGTRIDARSEDARRMMAEKNFRQPTPAPAEPPTSFDFLLAGEFRAVEEEKKTVVINIRTHSPTKSQEGIITPKEQQFVMTVSPQYT